MTEAELNEAEKIVLARIREISEERIRGIVHDIARKQNYNTVDELVHVLTLIDKLRPPVYVNMGKYGQLNYAQNTFGGETP